MYYNDAQKNFYNPPSWNQSQRDLYGPNSINGAQFNQMGQNYNNAQANFYDLPKVDFGSFQNDFFKKNNRW